MSLLPSHVSVSIYFAFSFTRRMTIGHALVAFKAFLVNRPVKDIENSVIRRHILRFCQTRFPASHPKIERQRDEEIEESDFVCV